MTDAIRLLHNAAEAYPAWLAAIAAARDEILLEMYWFESDKTGRRFAEALGERARAGVDVLVSYDALGSLGADPAMFDALRTAGAVVLEYHPVAPWRKRFRLDGIATRDHRKILVVDAHVGFTGGMNICDDEAPTEDGGGGWRDDAVQLTGAAVLELRALFFDTWLRLGGPAPRRGAAAVRRARREILAAVREQVGPPSVRPPALPPGGTALAVRPAAPAVQVLGHAAFGARRTIRSMYVRHVRQARAKILIENSYFIPDGAVRRALERAARRGVEVRVIVPAHPDVPSVGYASRALYAGLMRAGVHIHEWLEGMMHAKTAVIDDWATVGSYNLDYRSLRYNLEVNVASKAPDFAAAVEASIRADLAHCREVDPARWARRPLLEKVLEWVYFLVRRLL